MIRNFVIYLLLMALVGVPGVWGAETYMGNKLHATSKRLFIGGGDFSWHFCDKRLTRNISVYNFESGEKVGQLQFDRHIKAYDVHPSGRIGIVDDQSDLRIYDTDMKLLATIPDVVEESESIYFYWNEAGDKLAYLAYHPDPDIAYKVPYLFNLIPGTSEKIADYASSIRWAKHDGNIYYKIPQDEEGDYGVYKYDPTTKTTTKTNLLGVEFSADGMYYIGSRTEGWEETPYNLVYRTADNSVVPDAAVDVEKVYELGRYNHFLGNSHKVLTQWDAPRAIFDVDKRTYARKDIPDGLIGWSDDGSMLVIAEEGCKVRIEDSLTGQLVKELTIDAGN